MADRAVQAVDTSPPTVSGVLSPAAPNGANGWYTVPVTVTWAVADPQTAVSAQTGCGPAAPPDGDDDAHLHRQEHRRFGHGLGDGQEGLKRADKREGQGAQEDLPTRHQAGQEEGQVQGQGRRVRDRDLHGERAQDHPRQAHGDGHRDQQRRARHDDEGQVQDPLT